MGYAKIKSRGNSHGKFSLQIRNGVYYVQLWDFNKKSYLTAKSTRTKNVREATMIAKRMATDYPMRSVDFSKMKLVDYGRLQWADNGGLVEFRRMNGPDAITSEYIRNSRSNWDRHLKPLVKDTLLKDFKPDMFTTIYTELRLSKRQLSLSTIANILGTLRVTLRHATAVGHLDRDLVPKGLRIGRQGRVRDAFTDRELQALLSLEWSDHAIKLMIQFAAFGGARLGEILALPVRNLVEDSVRIDTSLSKVQGFKCPKSRKSRETVLPAQLVQELRAHALRNPFGTDLVFWNPINGGARDPKAVNKALRSGMAAIGINKNMVEARLLGFHAFRHWYVSALRGRVPESILGKAVGHTDPKTTDRYHHLTQDQRNVLGNALLPLWDWVTPGPSQQAEVFNSKQENTWRSNRVHLQPFQHVALLRNELHVSMPPCYSTIAEVGSAKS